MEIKFFKFSGGVWEYNGKWHCKFDINDIRDTFLFTMKDGEVTWKIFDKESSYTKERLELILEMALQDITIQKEIERTKKMIETFEKIKYIPKEQEITIKLLRYALDQTEETVIFQIEGYDLEFYSNTMRSVNYSFAYVPGRMSGVFIEGLNDHYPTWLMEKIRRAIRRDPKVRIKQLFKPD